MEWPLTYFSLFHCHPYFPSIIFLPFTSYLYFLDFTSSTISWAFYLFYIFYHPLFHVSFILFLLRSYLLGTTILPFWANQWCWMLCCYYFHCFYNSLTLYYLIMVLLILYVSFIPVFIGLFCGLYVIIMVWLSLCFIFVDLSFLIYFPYFRKTHDKF